MGNFAVPLRHDAVQLHAEGQCFFLQKTLKKRLAYFFLGSTFCTILPCACSKNRIFLTFSFKKGLAHPFLGSTFSMIFPCACFKPCVNSEGGYGINTQVEKYDNRQIHGMRFK